VTDPAETANPKNEMFLPFSLHRAPNYLLDEPTPEGETRLKARAYYLTDHVDAQAVITNVDHIALAELLLRQKHYQCRSNESVLIPADQATNSWYISVKVSDLETTPELATLERGRQIDQQALIGLAYALARGSCGGANVPPRDRVNTLYATAKEVGVEVELLHLRVAFLKLADFRLVAKLIEAGSLNQSELPAYFTALAQWQLELAFKTKEVRAGNYINPHQYGTSALDEMSDEPKILPDIRYLPYVLKTHLAYMEQFLAMLDAREAVEPRIVTSGVTDLYAYVSRAIAYYDAKGTHQGAQDRPMVVALAHELEPKFVKMVERYGVHYKTYLRLSREPDAFPTGKSPYSTDDRRADIHKHGGSDQGVGTNFDLRAEVKGNSD
jgi:hypothetical protein